VVSRRSINSKLIWLAVADDDHHRDCAYYFSLRVIRGDVCAKHKGEFPSEAATTQPQPTPANVVAVRRFDDFIEAFAKSMCLELWLSQNLSVGALVGSLCFLLGRL